MIYFAADVAESLCTMLRFVKPGGALFSVVTDEATAYGGSVLRAFIDSGGDTGDNAGHVAAIDERRRLLVRMPRAVVNFPPHCGRGASASTSNPCVSPAACTGTASRTCWR